MRFYSYWAAYYLYYGINFQVFICPCGTVVIEKLQFGRLGGFRCADCRSAISNKRISRGHPTSFYFNDVRTKLYL